MRTRHVAAVALLLITVACGGDGGSGLNPPGPSPVAGITGLSITPDADLIRLSTSETFTATATFSDGSSRPVPAAWDSDDPRIAAVDAKGRATGTGSGLATIIAHYQGLQATRPIRVIPDYQGLWQGDWRVTACRDEDDWSGLCNEFQPGVLWGLTVVVSQNRDAVTGTVDFGRLPGPMSGTIRTSGHLTLSGTHTITIEDDITIEIAVTDWETLTTDNEQMTGRFRATMRAAWCKGSLNIDGELHVVIKTTGVPVAAAFGGLPGLDRVVAHVLSRR